MTASSTILRDVKSALDRGPFADRISLIRHITDMFLVNASSLTEADVSQFDDVLEFLIREIDTSARALLAMRMATVTNAPPRAMHSLARDDESDVAGPVLSQFDKLDESTLVDVAQEKSQLHLLAISKRRSVTQAVSDILVTRGDAQVLMSIAANKGVQFSQEGMDTLVHRAAGNDRLAEFIGRRKDVPPHLFKTLLLRASDHVRKHLESDGLYAAFDVRKVIDDATNHAARRYEAATSDVDKARSRVRALHAQKQLDDEQIRAFAEDRELEEVRTALALISGLPLPVVEDTLKQEGSEILLVIARAMGLSWSTVRHILHLPIWARPIAPSEVRRCLTRYETLSRATALQILCFHKTRIAS